LENNSIIVKYQLYT